MIIFDYISKQIYVYNKLLSSRTKTPRNKKSGIISITVTQASNMSQQALLMQLVFS
jgi:hypothetical protein